MSSIEKRTLQEKWSNFLEKPLPVWFFLLCLFLGVIFTVVFGWKAMEKAPHGISHTIYTIASFPSTAEKAISDVWNDLFNRAKFVYAAPADIPYDGFAPLAGSDQFQLDNTLIKAEKDSISPGWRIITGAFSIDGTVENAALLLNPELKVVHKWSLTEEKIGDEIPRAPHRKFVHGFSYFDDGSIMYAFDGGISIQRQKLCGDALWRTAGPFHHSITLTEDSKYAWGLEGILIYDGVSKIDTKTGEVVAHFSLQDVIANNPEINILEMRSKTDEEFPETGNSSLDWNRRESKTDFLEDPFHINDVEPLPANLAEYFESFNAGDLLISVRNLNLIMVIDPETLKIKWWKIGLTHRQHDPDWGKGKITVLDNQMYHDYSRIISVIPSSFSSSTIFDGKQNDFYTRIRGKHQIIDGEHILITSSGQGRYFELDNSGKTVLEIVSRTQDLPDTNLVASQAIFIPSGQFKLTEEDFLSCKN